MHKNQPKQESNQALLARVKKEMDEPRMAESTREEYDSQPHYAAGVGKAAVMRRKKSRVVRAQGDAVPGQNLMRLELVSNQQHSRTGVGLRRTGCN
jgi:hypothetical protein